MVASGVSVFILQQCNRQLLDLKLELRGKGFTPTHNNGFSVLLAVIVLVLLN